MNEIDRWIYLDGDVPASVRPLLDALREEEAPRPAAEDKARAIADFFTTFDARLARIGERGEEEAPAPAPIEAGEDAVPTDAPLDFEAWATLSLRFLGADEEAQADALTRRRITPEAWAAIDAEYLRALADDVLEGRTDRQARYAALCGEELARRAAESDEDEDESAGEEDEDEGVATPALPRVPLSQRGTAELPEIPASMRAALAALSDPVGMRFQEEPASVKELKRATPKTLKGAVSRPSVSETLPLGSDAIQKATATLPFPDSPGGAAVVVFPNLPVGDYVRLRAQLVAMPEVRAETLKRYGVANEAAMQAMAAHWWDVFRDSAEVRAAFETEVANFARWVRGW